MISKVNISARAPETFLGLETSRMIARDVLSPNKVEGVPGGVFSLEIIQPSTIQMEPKDSTFPDRGNTGQMSANMSVIISIRTR